MPTAQSLKHPALLIGGLALLAACDTADRAARAGPETLRSADGLQVQRIASGLEHPWGLALLPDGTFLVTERPGRLRRVSAAGALGKPLAGVPAVHAEGQGGLLDVALAPDFATTGRVCLTYAAPGPQDTSGTAFGCGRLGGSGIEGFRRLYLQRPLLDGGHHFGSRIAFDASGHVFVSQGDRNRRTAAQDPAGLQGKLVRLKADGSVPSDNPFANRGGMPPETWSYGHRNMQSLAIDPRSGRLWAAEHGPRGGDELNLPTPGRNYGWPIASHGKDYTSFAAYPETRGATAPGTEPPHHVWEKSPALSGMAFVTGRPRHPWNDSLFLGALSGRALIRLSLDGDRIVGEERLLEDLGQRIRDVRAGPDGSVYVLTDEADGSLLKLSPPVRR